MSNEKSASKLTLPSAKGAWRWIVYIVLFLTIFGALDYGYYSARGTSAERLLIDTLTVRPAAAVINAVVPAAAVAASGHSLVSPFGQINILQGCEGTEGMFLLIAAVLPFPAHWKWKLAGAAGGVLVMYALNQLRILALVVSLHWHREWFASLHGLIAPTFIVVAGSLFFFAWANATTARVHA